MRDNDELMHYRVYFWG